MSSIVDSLIEKVKKLLVFLFKHFLEIGQELWKGKDGIPFNNLMADFFATLSSAGMMLVFNIIAFVVFLFLPQGKDVMLIVSEDVGEHRFGTLAWLLVGTFVWSIFSEFGVRYAIYVTDNSGNSLSDMRVKWRRTLQGAISDSFLVIPYLIVLLGMIFNRPVDSLDLSKIEKDFSLWVPLVSVYLVLSFVSYLYFDKLRGTTTGWWTKWKLPLKEKEWCEKLTGIYNDYVFFLPKYTNFQGDAAKELQAFENNFLAADTTHRNIFPKSEHLVERYRVPDTFALIKYTEDFTWDDDKDPKANVRQIKLNENGRYRWVYRIPNNFYRALHKKLLTITGVSLVFFTVVVLLGIGGYQNIGAPGLLVLSFACWTGIYLGVMFVDHALLRRGRPVSPGMPVPDSDPPMYKQPVYRYGEKWKGSLSLRALLFIMLIFSSYTNDDHPVPNDTAGPVDNRPTLGDHFDQWMTNYIKEASCTQYCTYNEPQNFYPVVFVCAEGGALRTGAYTSLILSELQDKLHAQGVDFRKSIYAFSGVSGGSLGIAFFNTIAYFNGNTDTTYNYNGKSKDFFENDFLAPVIGKLAYGDVLNLVLPFHVAKFDRAIALEDIWQAGYNRIDKVNYFADDYLNTYGRITKDAGMASYPAMFINTTEVESGLQCWITNVKPDSSMFYGADRDLLAEKIKGGISYATAVNFSTRFPLISPAGCLRQSPVKKLHYVDAGYVENTVSATMTEILRALKPHFDSFNTRGYHIHPYVITIRYGNDTSQPNLDLGNEVTEILYGIYNTRDGRVKMAEKELGRLVNEYHGKVISLPLALDANEVPLNWVLSARSLDSLELFVNRTWVDRAKNDLRGLYCLNTDPAVYSTDCNAPTPLPATVKQVTPPKNNGDGKHTNIKKRKRHHQL